MFALPTLTGEIILGLILTLLIQVCKKLSPYHKVNQQDIARIRLAAVKVKLKKVSYQETLVARGEEGNQIFMVLSGNLSLRVPLDQDQDLDVMNLPDREGGGNTRVGRGLTLTLTLTLIGGGKTRDSRGAKQSKKMVEIGLSGPGDIIDQLTPLTGGKDEKRFYTAQVVAVTEAEVLLYHIP